MASHRRFAIGVGAANASVLDAGGKCGKAGVPMTFTSSYSSVEDVDGSRP